MPFVPVRRVPEIGDEIEVTGDGDTTLVGTVDEIVSRDELVVEVHIDFIAASLRMAADRHANGRWHAWLSEAQVEASNAAL